MSHKVGCIMIVSGVCIMASLSLKLLIQPFITEDHYIHDYFPSTEIVLGIPILIGFLFFTGFGIYILKETLKENMIAT